MTDQQNLRGGSERDADDMDSLLDPRLDSLLQSIDDVPVSAQLQRRIAEIPLRHPRASEQVSWWPWMSVRKSATAALVICALGALVGASDVAASVIDEPTSTVYADDGLALAFGISSDEDTTP